MNSKPLQVFEHTHLPIGIGGFERRHWNALGKYNELHGGKYYRLTHNGVRFNQYVGVIQVDNLTIEILPKIGRSDDNQSKATWQKVLIDMLRECLWMKIYSDEKADLQFKPNSILEAYLDLFIRECETIYREGLVKKYRRVNDNCASLKGKLLFNGQIRENLIHRERFFTSHTYFDRENIFNCILLKALKIIPFLSPGPFLKDRVSGLLLAFPELKDIPVTHDTFENLVYDRKTIRYKEAMEMAAMIILNFRPDVSHGNRNVLAILFDMNDLWEEFIYMQLSRRKPQGWLVRPQNKKLFWHSGDSGITKTIRPDIILQKLHENDTINIIIDTKWKLPQNNIPDDADLKQMYVYNEYWNGTQGFLIYPTINYSGEPEKYPGSFTPAGKMAHHTGCGIFRISVLDDSYLNLDRNIGAKIFNCVIP